MIEFEKIVIKNFLSVGDNPLVLELNRSPTTLVTGRNGCGKSAIVADSLSFALFGKSFRGINKGALINTINQRDSLTEIYFTKGQDAYKIIRGQKPNRLEIFVNGVAVNEEAANRDTQAYIENDILGFDFASFIRVCLLSTMNYTPFMQLSAFERRNLVENMLSLRVFSEMSKIHKQNTANIKDQIHHLTTDLQVKRTKYEERRRTLELLEQIDTDRAEMIKGQLKDLVSKLEDLDVIISNYENEIGNNDVKSIDCELNQSRLTLSKLQTDIREHDVEQKIAKKKISFFTDHTECDQCHQSISAELIEEQTKRYRHEVIVHETEIQKLKTELNQVSGSIDDLIHTANSLKECVKNLEYSKRSKSVLAADIRKKFDELSKTTNASGDLEKTKEEVIELKGQLKYISNKFDIISKKRDTYSIANELLKDGGIKSTIIKQYIPMLVGYVNHYLEELNISIKFSMDENFNESITTRYANEYQYGNLSMGERSRLDLAIAFAWRQIAKLKGSVHCNILILDEILDQALDIDGTNAALGVLDALCDKTNVFIISHKANLDESVRSIIALEKVNGFTKIVPHSKP